MHRIFNWLQSKSDVEVERDQIRKSIAALSRLGRLTFLASITERVFPFYHAFAARHGWDLREICRQSLNRIWVELEVGSEPSELKTWAAYVSAKIPDGVDYPDENAVLIQAAPGILWAYISIIDGNLIEPAVCAAMVARDVADQLAMQQLYPSQNALVNSEISESISKVKAHPIMIQEVARQSADIATLQAHDAIRTAIDTVRKRSAGCSWR